MYKKHYQKFITDNPERLHFAAHSHHPWPDITREAHMKYWDTSARLMDDKWSYIFSEIIPDTQKLIAKQIGSDTPEQIVFAPNTHEFVCRIFSCLDFSKPVKVLTTDSEYHSFTRQARRLNELENVTVIRVPVEPFNSFEARFSESIEKDNFDLIFVSQSFFTSGYTLKDVSTILSKLKSQDTLFVLDGYHTFCALPIELNPILDRAFFVAGGYKYAQAGEGTCFLHVPKGCNLRPIDSGWYSSFSSLEQFQEFDSPVEYEKCGFRFWGATFDPSGIFRLNAVLSWFEKDNITIEAIHNHVVSLQTHFLEMIANNSNPAFSRDNILIENLDWHAHFLSIRLPDAKGLYQKLHDKGVITDYRGDLLRIGFGMYHDIEDVNKLLEILSSI